MKKSISMILAVLLALVLAGSAMAGAADTVVTGRIYTSDEKQPWAEAMAIQDGKFVYVGDMDGVQDYIGEGTKIIHTTGMITPGLIDAHTHPATIGMSAWHVRMGVPDYDGIISFITQYLAEHSKEEAPFVYFEYYPTNLFGPEGPNKAPLDEIAPDRPILVRDFNDHASWVNSKCLELLGVYKMDPKDPQLEYFVRDESGDFTGWVLELGYAPLAHNMYEALGWEPPDDPTVEVMKIATGDLKKWGVTGVFDAFIEDAMQPVSVYEMDRAGELNMYYDMSFVLQRYGELEEVIATIRALDEAYRTEHVKIDTLKIFYDGTNELGESALIGGTEPGMDNNGYMLLDYKETKEVIRRCNEEGIDVHFHIAGDLAFRTVCDVTEELIKEQGPLQIQVEMAHCELIDPADYSRPAELGIIINWTPHWSGGYFGDAALQYLGQERYDRMYQFNPIIDSGAIVTFGSDCYSMFEERRANPYFGMQTAMTRIDIDQPIDAENPMRQPEDAKLTLEKLLKGYTIDAAKQLRVDDKAGSIEEGKSANYNIYGVNLFEVPVDEFKDILPEYVVFEGKVIEGTAKE